ncbi:hypothetical protein D5F01_LYC02089 [Larimichthys crocea]|uniref:DUF6729 domain-containing protein n=1 Tax=Larimichthys crocea TaxID=215358 RepID=A0A6G0J7V0_LARCR|nr:hypothetical protein D5F01_LYC02089 [Larimichthys crocea]
MNSSGIYRKVREVIDVDSRYYLVGGDYPRCSKCFQPVCPCSQDILSQLDVAHRSLFPTVLTTQLALDRKCITFLRPRTSACHSPPPPFRPLPLAQWFETVHSNDILSHLDEMKGAITSTYGRILKMDSTKKDVQRLKEAKRAEWKSSHSGHAPTEKQLMATISPGELKRHCRRRTCGVEEIRRMISELLESVWELTDTTGLHLVNNDSMRHVWEVQQKHPECLQDPPGVALYTKVGTLQKGGKELDILRCGCHNLAQRYDKRWRPHMLLNYKT